ncbi:MAG: hypothetical protein K8R87_11190 [Verrucomicrobia bacterium]|nr:hypothetical protein [Verrucomicrobiota bacterium]
MSESEEILIQKLIRLKRHERPPEGFVDDFVSAFKDRQRSEMLHRSARGLLWERMSSYFSEVLNPKWAWATATVAAVALLGITLRPHAATGLQVAQNQPDDFQVTAFTASDPNAVIADVENYLKATEYEPVGAAAPQTVMKPRVVQPRQGEMIPASLGNRPTFTVQH